TGFLEEAEYRELLARADIGISVHRSSSGLDLAMKVVDLQEAGVPVLAFDYGGSLPEQVSEGKAGFLFRNADELAKLVEDRSLSRSISTSTIVWAEEWSAAAS